MKKNTNPATENDLKNVAQQSPDSFKVREGQPDSSILADKDPITRENKEDKPYKEQDEFISSSSNKNTKQD
ncbi:hypothetical protein SAMN05421788_11424 [Filimonas lacunae]|uniref:Uncharacterized protein n=1 Tax=Filimonas lacunae TaxID=477680 RepID=A0A173MM16_9BACT|nr:hypothetical protein [Filimonas lacunae]BAV08441.1 hypothetical protein FLA_4482 [Filimonas lacunae]SIT33935.1 hypothetical protein SAMN05421788_11424 [Filimonas lacunae]